MHYIAYMAAVYRECFRTLVLSFFFLATLQLAIISKCFKLLPSNLDTMTMTTSHLCHMTLRGQKVIQRSQGSKVWFCYKKFQLQQKASNCDEIWAYELSLACAQKLFVELNSKVIKGDFRVKFEKNLTNIQKSISAECKVVESFYLHR